MVVSPVPWSSTFAQMESLMHMAQCTCIEHVEALLFPISGGYFLEQF